MIEDSQIINMFNHIYYETLSKSDGRVKALLKGLNSIEATYVIQWLSKDKVRIWCDQDDFDNLIGELNEEGE